MTRGLDAACYGCVGRVQAVQRTDSDERVIWAQCVPPERRTRGRRWASG